MEHTPESNTADPMLPRPFSIRRVKRETADTFTMEMEAMDGSELRFAAGQFNMLYVFGVGEAAISISGDSSQTGKIIHTTRAVGTVTRAMSRLKRGDAIGVRGPFGTRWPIERAAGSDVALVAGGIGLAPLRPVLYGLLAQREKYGRIVLLYGARTPADLLYSKELEQWRARFDLDVLVTVDRGDRKWHGNVGVVTTLISRAAFDPLNTVALLCGPEVMMRFTVMEMQKRGLRPEDIYVSMERNMKCAVGFCGHCQWGANFICKDGPVFRYSDIESLLGRREI
jgi:NAD(P)H-flavin reductase